MSSGGVTPAPGGGSQPHTQEVFYGGPYTIANNAQSALAWPVGAHDALLDLTVPTLPTVVTTGIYAVSAYYSGNDFTAGGYFIARLELDTAGEDVFCEATSNLKTAADGPEVTLSATWYLTAGMTMKVLIQNRDGVSARDFFSSVYVQRIG